MLITPTHHIGVPTQIGPLTVFPVWTDAPVPRRAIRTVVPKKATVQELADGAQVNTLHLVNPTEKTFLLPRGYLLTGGLQHRVLANSAVIQPRSEAFLDVRCVEQGRWGGSTDQRIGARYAPLAVRGALNGIRRDRSTRHQPGWAARADQGDVWSRVNIYEQLLGPSESNSIVEITARVDVDAREIARSVKLLPGQRGVLIGIGGHPVLMEVFDHPRTLADEIEAILAGVAVDARFVPVEGTPARRARTFAAAASRRRLDCRASTSTGAMHEANDNLVSIDAVAVPEGSGLNAAGDRAVHMSILNARHILVGAS
ncbi:MAG: hypothetical protein KDB26_08515 [Microthrixaceae bacterium]|nr:hypothetical protein [Microthrixaceae bacterium]